MILYIFSTRKDLSLPRIEEEAKKENISYKTIYFETLSFIGTSLVTDGKQLQIGTRDKILIRWPFDADNTEVEYNIFVHFLLINHKKHIVFDRKCLQQFTPFYEDKLFQSLVFNKLSIPSPTTYLFQTLDEVKEDTLSFPCVLKKRISSRSKNNFLISFVEDIYDKVRDDEIASYILQDAIDIMHDVRIVLLKNEVIGTVKRFTHTRAGNRLSVKGREVFTHVPPKAIDDARTLSDFFGADFVGFDVLFDTNGNYYFIEANLSPQFDKFEEATGINLAKKLMQEVR